MEKRRQDYDKLDLGLVVVSQGTPELLRQFLTRNPKPYPVVGDPQRVVYRAAGLDRVSPLVFLNPRVIAGYAVEFVRGRGANIPYAGEDVMQRGGDFVVTREGEVVYAHRSKDPVSRPAVADVLAGAGQRA